MKRLTVAEIKEMSDKSLLETYGNRYAQGKVTDLERLEKEILERMSMSK